MIDMLMVSREVADQEMIIEQGIIEQQMKVNQQIRRFV